MLAKLEASAQNCLGLDPLPFMAKQTGLLEVIFKMTVKNCDGGKFWPLASSCSHVFVPVDENHTDCRADILVDCLHVRTGNVRYKLSRFCTQLLTSTLLGEGKWHQWLCPLLRSFCHYISDTY